MRIENIALEPSTFRTGLTADLDRLEVGQSVVYEMTYPSAYNCIQQAKRRKSNPLTGEFRVKNEPGGKVRVGRVG